MSKWFASEEQMAGKVIAKLKADGWEIYQEVSNGYACNRADIVAVKDNKSWVIETKLHLNCEVCHQAYLWRDYADYVSVAVPPSRGKFPLEFFLRHHNIGIIEVVDYGKTSYTLPPQQEVRSLDNKLRVIDRVVEAHKDFCPAGTSGKYWTSFKQTCQNVEAFVLKNPGCTIKQIADQVEHHYANAASARGAMQKSIPRFIKVKEETSTRPYRYYPISH